MEHGVHSGIERGAMDAEALASIGIRLDAPFIPGHILERREADLGRESQVDHDIACRPRADVLQGDTQAIAMGGDVGGRHEFEYADIADLAWPLRPGDVEPELELWTLFEFLQDALMVSTNDDQLLVGVLRGDDRGYQPERRDDHTSKSNPVTGSHESMTPPPMTGTAVTIGFSISL
jgi:hypothetical protein